MDKSACCGAEVVEREDVETISVLGDMVKVDVIVLRCTECGLEYTDHRGADARDAAVKEHLEGKDK